MSRRFDLRPLLSGVVQGLRKRRPIGDEPADVRTRRILIVTPLVAAALIAGFRVELTGADQMLAGMALLIGALVVSFSQVASWRERLLERDRKVDQMSIRSLDEAAAHILFGVVLAGVATAAFGTLANIHLGINDPGVVRTVAAVALSAVGVAIYVYILLTLVITVNLLWDAYERSGSGKSSLPR